MLWRKMILIEECTFVGDFNTRYTRMSLCTKLLCLMRQHLSWMVQWIAVIVCIGLQKIHTFMWTRTHSLVWTVIQGFNWEICGDCVNCSNTTAKDAGLAMQGLPDLCLCTPCTVPSSSSLLRMPAIVSHVGGSTANSRLHCLCMLHTFSNSQYCFKIILRCSNDNHSAKLSCVVQMTTILPPFLWLPCHSIRWLWHSYD
jgi:hypothetical protein